MSYRHPALRESALACVVYDDLPILACKDSTFFLIIATFPQLFLLFLLFPPPLPAFFQPKRKPHQLKSQSLHLTGWTALCSLMCGRQQGSVKPTAGSRVAVSREGVGVCPLPNDWRFTSQGRAVYLLFVDSLLTGYYDSTQSLEFPLNKGKAEGLVLP